MSDLDDKKAAILKASKEAAAKADKLVEPQLTEFTDQADELTRIFTDLKLNDRDTYDGLIKIVAEATERNESIGAVIERVKALGKASAGLLAGLSSLTGAGAVAGLGNALKK